MSWQSRRMGCSAWLKWMGVVLGCFGVWTGAGTGGWTEVRAEVYPAGEPGLTGRVIVVDAGHGGPDGGAVGVGGLQEKDVTLAISLYLADFLRQAGAVVYLTRTTDRDLAADEDRAAGRRHRGDLRGRVEYTLSKRPSAYVSIHCNAVPSPVWRGAHTIYMKGNEPAQRLAEDIQDAFRALLLPTTRQPDDMDTLYVLKRIPGPAVLAEVGFLSNPDEAAHLATAAYQRLVAFSVYIGLLHYFADGDGEPGDQGDEAVVPQPGDVAAVRAVAAGSRIARAQEHLLPPGCHSS
ncbi:MAG: N-acetylmuramoyl-L-alanine amidase [Alicyclobacillus sp.]|nr:N-acetylmuramoyl-L-alanine amidase [Alicyclobacillus sp.]